MKDAPLREAALQTTMEPLWSRRTLCARISDFGLRRRFAGGSPDDREIRAYASALPAESGRERAVILGMTPELRRLAAQKFSGWASVEINPDAIDLYRGWLDEPQAAKEAIIKGDWFDLEKLVPEPVSTILGDGIFGNLSDVYDHRRLLGVLRRALKPRGRLIIRQAMIPTGFNPEAHAAPVLLERFRRGRIDEAEFGFGLRLVGHFRCCYEPYTCVLDNAKLFKECEDDFRKGRLTPQEYQIVLRYRYGGRNCILPQAVWERALATAGFDFRVIPCFGKEWYDYYRVYACVKTA